MTLEELEAKYLMILTEEPANGCKLMVFLRWLGRRSEVELEIRKKRAEVWNESASPTVPST